MSTAVRPRLAIRHFHAASWAPSAILAADVVAIEVAFALGLGFRLLMAPWFTKEVGISQFAGVAAGILLLPVVHYQIGLYPGYMLGPVERLRRRMLATVAVFGGLVAWDNIVARGLFSRGVLLATFVFALILPPLAETAVRSWLVQRRCWGIPIVILGAGPAGCSIAKKLQAEPQHGLHPVAFLDNRPESWNRMVENVPVIGPLGLASDLGRHAEAAVVALADLTRSDAAGLLPELNFPRVIVIPDLAGAASMWVTARDLGGCLGFEIKKNLMISRNHVLKILMDRAIALPLFLASLPVIVIAALWVRLVSRGPVFYRQIREGLEGKPIAVWKLRTMYADGDSILRNWFEAHPQDRAHWLKHFKLRRDPRVLPLIGTLLRRTSLDELPQLWSVLRGEMSLVGPRPLPEYHLQQFAGEFRSLRARVLPGLTGLWQVSARGDADLELHQALDTFYIRNWSPWLDLYILARTFSAVVLSRGAY